MSRCSRSRDLLTRLLSHFEKVQFKVHRATKNVSVRSDEGLNAGNVSFRISLRWPIRIINPVDKTKLSKNVSVSFSGNSELLLFISGTNTALHEFLHARNPKNQHSGTLESYLIKPIQVNNEIIFLLFLFHIMSCTA